MTAKEFLLRGRLLQGRIRALQTCKRRAYERATSATTHLHKVDVRGKGPGRSDDAMAEYAKLSAQIDAETARLFAIQRDLLDLFSEMEDNRLAQCMIEYYVNGKTWEQVAELTHYSVQYMSRALHPRALHWVQRRLDARDGK